MSSNRDGILIFPNQPFERKIQFSSTIATWRSSLSRVIFLTRFSRNISAANSVFIEGIRKAKNRVRRERSYLLRFSVWSHLDFGHARIFETVWAWRHIRSRARGTRGISRIHVDRSLFAYICMWHVGCEGYRLYRWNLQTSRIDFVSFNGRILKLEGHPYKPGAREE